MRGWIAQLACAVLSVAPGCALDHLRPDPVGDASTMRLDAHPIVVDAHAVGVDAARADASDDDAAPSACDGSAPRPLAPLSTASVSSRRPTLRWATAPGCDGARVEICSDRACSTLLEALDAAGTSAAPSSELPAGTVYWRLRARGAALSAPSATWQLEVGARTAPADTSWGTTLDVDGDGFGDVVIGASGGLRGRGRVYLHLGGPSGTSEAPSAVLDGPDEGGSFGDAVVSAGDVNGDGYADLLVGAPRTRSLTGRAFLYLGSAGGLATSAASVLEGPDGSGAFFGRAVASLGDVNGDGYADVAIGAHMFGGSAGRLHVYLGGPAGLDGARSTTLDAPDGAGSLFGLAAAGADLDGDGFAELVVGAIGAAAHAGRVYLYRGSAAGLVTDAPTILAGPGGEGGSFGYSVACAGDVNGDGLPDLAVGAPELASSTGAAYVYFGARSGLAASPSITLSDASGARGLFGFPLASAGDVNGDGWDDLVVGAYQTASNTGAVHVFFGGASGVAATADEVLAGLDGPSGYFGGSVAGAGDVDGDGHADVVIGAFVVAHNTGRAFVFLGGASGLASSAATSLTGPDGPDGNFGYWVARAEVSRPCPRAARSPFLRAWRSRPARPPQSPWSWART